MGEQVKNWSKLTTDSTKKNCRHGGGGCQKFGKIADVVCGWSLNPIKTKCNGLDRNLQPDESETFSIGATHSQHTFWTKSEFLLYVRWLNKIVHLSFSSLEMMHLFVLSSFLCCIKKKGGKMALQMPFKKEQKVLETTNASLAKLQISSYKISFSNSGINKVAMVKNALLLMSF